MSRQKLINSLWLIGILNFESSDLRVSRDKADITLRDVMLHD